MSQPQNPSLDDPKFQRQMRWRYAAWVVLALVIGVTWLQYERAQQIRELSYTEFKAEVRAGDIREITVRGDQITGMLRTPADAADQGTDPGKSNGAESPGAADGAPEEVPFTTTRPAFEDPELMPLLKEHDVTINALSGQRPWWQELLINLLPWVLVFGVILWITWRMQERMAGAGGQLFSFGRSKARRYREESTGVSLDDVAGAENAKQDVAEIVDYLRDPERYRKLGARVPRGVLLMGPPGTGKTLLAKAVAGEADVPFYSLSGSEFIEMFVGVGASRVRDTFQSAKSEAPAIIFIDELDAIGRVRGAGLGGGHDEREQTLNQILSEMDGFQAHETVVVLAATNRPDVLDPALLRPGRFDRKVTLDRPDRQAREAILKVHARHVPLAKDVDLAHVAGQTTGFAGADLANLVNEAALLAGREGLKHVTARCFEQARDKIVLGPRREDAIDDDEKKVIAVHEGGHTLAAALLPRADSPDRVTIIPRGQALGATEQTPDRERYNLSRPDLVDRIGVMLGGRIAERICFGEVSTGAENDLKQATSLARRMVSQWGMSERLGPLAFRQGENHPFLGREMSQERDYSEHTAQLIDEEVKALMEDTEARVEKLLTRHRKDLDALAEALLKEETLAGEALGRHLPKPAEESAKAG